MLENNRVLYVAWQDSVSRRFYPVARLSWLGEERSNSLYEFVYIRGAMEATTAGFQPFLNFPNLDQRYLGRKLFPFFANRVMSAKRADFPEYLTRLGLDQASNSAFEILGRSGGGRTTDAIEVFSLPTLVLGTGIHRMYFFVHSLRYLPQMSQDRMEKLVSSEQLRLMYDVQNPVDRSAIALRTEDLVIVGFMPAYLTELVQYFMKYCQHVTISVDRVNPHPAPIQQRLLCLWESACSLPSDSLTIQRYLPLPEDASAGPFIGREQNMMLVDEEIAG